MLLSLLVLSPLTAAAASAGIKTPSSGLVTLQPKLLHVVREGSLPFALHTADGDHAEIFLESSTPGIEFVVLAPGGQQVQAVKAEYPEWLAASFPVTQSGQYSLVARVHPLKENDGAAEVRVSVLSFSGDSAERRTKAEELFASAQSLLRSPNAANLRQAIAKDTQAGASWALAGNREGQILALSGEARAWLGLSEHDKAIAALTRATSLSAPISFWHAWLVNLQAQVYLDRWESEPARKKADESLRLSLILDDEWLMADTLANRGESEYLTHQPSAQIDIEESLRLAKETDAIGTLARALRCSAWIAKDQGALTSAFARLDQARQYFHREGDVRAEFQSMSTLAAIGNTAADPFSSLLRHTEIAALLLQSGSTSHYAVLLENIGADYMALNRIPDAILYFRQAQKAFQSTRHASGEALALADLCSAEVQDHRLHEALRDCQAATVIVKQFHDPKRTATSIWRLGKVQMLFGRTVFAIGSFRQAEALSESVHDTRFAAQALLDWGDAVAGLGRNEEAQHLFEKALSLSQAAENVALQVEARYRIARSAFERGHQEDAKRELDIALKSIETLRRTVRNADLQAAYFAQVRKCHDLYVEILESNQVSNQVSNQISNQERHPSSGDPARALEVSESGRALTLLDAMAVRDANSGVTDKAAVPDELGDLHLAVERAYDQRLKLMIEGVRPGDLDANATTLTEAIDSLERAEDEQKAGRKQSTQTGRTLSSAQVAAASESNHATFVEYALGPNHSYAWVIDHGRIESHVLPAQDHIVALVKEWRELVTARISRPGEAFENHLKRIEAADKRLPSVAAHLSCVLLGSFLQPGMENLVIVPDGELYLLPFAALPDNGCQGGGEAIVIKHRIVLTPSLSVFLARQQAASGTPFRGDVAILADPVFDQEDPRVHRTGPSAGRNISPLAPILPRLIGTRDEAKAIAALAGPGRSTLYLDFDARLQTLSDPSIGAYRILHLASHGVLDESRPGFSGIVLSLVGPDGQPVFGFLKTRDIVSLNLHSDLVVLSSCDSAAGINLSGEGVAGLSHAFLSAGAKRVVSTLWSVDDEASRRLMVSFYTGMLRDGLDPPEALRKSQIEMMRYAGTAEPYYWAAFNITSAVQ